MKCPYCEERMGYRKRDYLRKDVHIPHCDLEDEELAKWVAGKETPNVSV